MKATNKIIAGIGLIAVAGLIIYLGRRKRLSHIHEQIAEHGYETAHDVLFPNKHKQKRKHKYGPILPS